MKRPAVTKETLTSKVVEGNLIHWLHYLKEDFDRFVIENRDLMTDSNKIACIDITDFILRGIEDEAVKNFVLHRDDDDRILHYLQSAVTVLNSETVQEALERL